MIEHSEALISFQIATQIEDGEMKQHYEKTVYDYIEQESLVHKLLKEYRRYKKFKENYSKEYEKYMKCLETIASLESLL